MRTEITDAAIEHGTGGTAVRVRLDDWFDVEVITGHRSGCTPRPASPLPSRWDLPASAPADYAGPYSALQVGLVLPLTAPAGWPAPLSPHPRHASDVTWYAQVPAELLRALVRAHGGENADQHLTADDWATHAD